MRGAFYFLEPRLLTSERSKNISLWSAQHRFALQELIHRQKKEHFIIRCEWCANPKNITNVDLCAVFNFGIAMVLAEVSEHVKRLDNEA